MLAHFGGLIKQVKEHAQQYFQTLVDLILHLWNTVALRPALLPLILITSNITKLDQLRNEVIPKLLPLVLNMFESASSPDDEGLQHQIQILNILVKFGTVAEVYSQHIISIMTATLDQNSISISLQKCLVNAIDQTIQKTNISYNASHIVHSLVKALPEARTEVCLAILNALCSLAHQIGTDFLLFVPVISAVCWASSFSL